MVSSLRTDVDPCLDPDKFMLDSTAELDVSYWQLEGNLKKGSL